MHFQWYPGHMTKARRMMQENIKLIDLIIELVDARVPLGSRNPDIDELGRNKSRIILLNKADLAEDAANDEWIDFFKEKGYSAVKVNSKSIYQTVLLPAVRPHPACYVKREKSYLFPSASVYKELFRRSTKFPVPNMTKAPACADALICKSRKTILVQSQCSDFPVPVKHVKLPRRFH